MSKNVSLARPTERSPRSGSLRPQSMRGPLHRGEPRHAEGMKCWRLPGFLGGGGLQCFLPPESMGPAEGSRRHCETSGSGLATKKYPAWQPHVGSNSSYPSERSSLSILKIVIRSAARKGKRKIRKSKQSKRSKLIKPIWNVHK